MAPHAEHWNWLPDPMDSTGTSYPVDTVLPVFGHLTSAAVSMLRSVAPARPGSRPEDPAVTLTMDAEEARAVWNAIGCTVELMRDLDVPSHAALYGKRDELIEIRRRLDREIKQATRRADARAKIEGRR